MRRPVVVNTDTVTPPPSDDTPRSPTKPRRRLRARAPWYDPASLSVNPFVVYPLIILAFIAFQLGLSYITTRTFTFGLLAPRTPEHRLFTPAELRAFDGRNPARPIYLAIMGDVFDVSAGPQYYGPDGGYSIFAGRDGTRAFLTGCFDDTGATHDLRGLSEQQLASVRKWRDFYAEHGKYRLVGRVLNPPVEEDAPLPNDDCK